MKIRSFLLFACMIVVPMLAMFSHQIPPEVRLAARRHLWEPAQRALSGSKPAPEPEVVAAMPTAAIDAADPITKPFPDPVSPPLPAPEPRAALPSGTVREIEGRLAALGGFAFECVPVTADDSLHRCACRVAADPSGQLQRVFQASGPEPVAAMQQLLEQVQAWKERIAANPPATPTGRF
jgi:hypothetical protein